MKRIGIIGCGKIAQTRHIPEYAANENAMLVGFYDFNMERAQEIAVNYGGKSYESVEALLSDPQIDAVSVCVANNAHAEITRKALEAGKDVLCEKPMAVTIADCEKMVKTAEEKGRKLMIGQNQRLAKAHAKAKELMEQDVIGNIITFKTTFGHGGPETWSIDPGKNSWFFDRSKASMGAMADLGVHKTDLIQFLTGQKVVETTAKVVTLHKRDLNGDLIGVDDNAICIYQMENGAIGTMTASWTYYGSEDNSTILYGTKGIMRIYDNPQYSIEVITADGEKILYDIDRIQTNDNQTRSGIIDAFIEALEEDKEPVISGKSVLSAMRAVFASIESAERGVTVAIPENR
ncbi:MAG: Gfo/Idh/MocA family oxidoreductase [Lachnospiraceae bacterium]|nr:Gfo/Idh/MocA family oxidoreductase [Lachnospiraceae bacterium]